MRPHIHVVTLGVEDLERAVRFYRDGLGFTTDGIVGAQHVGSADEPAGAAAMFTLDDGLILSLYPRTELAKDAHLEAGSLAGFGFSLGHMVSSRAEVDALLERAGQAGATLTAPPHERPWGIYSGYFRDLDGHLWEVIYFPEGGSADESD